ncbi:MAG: sensor domain-containing phosphodiesterase [Lachnospiraceae bacterium]|nr:sensor domain-containing phosphodiesterase [Lachnospiraceae bacterium]
MTDDHTLIDYVFKRVEENQSIDSILMGLFEKIGKEYCFQHISIKEVKSTSSRAIKCTYEWSLDGTKTLLNLENRFEDRDFYDIKTLYENENAKFKVFAYFESSPDMPTGLMVQGVKSMLRVPLVKEGNFCGYIDFVDKTDERRMFIADEINTLKSVAKMVLMYIFPIRELEQVNNEAKEFSEFDSLTHLLKYEYVYDNLQKIVNSDLEGSRLDFISIDFSNFKFINEKYGYVSGNNILYEIAQYIYTASDNIIACCRPYSDNFYTVLKVDENVSLEYVKQRVEYSANEMLEKVRKRFFDCNIIVNCGIYSMKSGEKDIEKALFNANLARKFAKHENIINCCRCLIYKPEMSKIMDRQADYVSSMKKGLLEGDFFVQYQPVCTTDTRSIVSAEALVRWKKDNEILRPDEFIKVFEENGCIINLDYYVYDRVFDFISRRLKANKPVVPISLNVSIIHFYSLELLDHLDGLMKKYQVGPEYIHFELSERIYISDFVGVKDVIEGLNKRGFKVYIDGFGSGYSSLNTLTKFDIDGIMLDRKFMKEKLEYKDKIVISCIVDMANKLDLDVFCVGVENEDQRNFLIKNECPYMQGNLFCEPIDEKDFEKML